ncbi:two-component system LytT family response regulator [Granulicella aggregans]|jgi:two-component system LytT family response regulator|uniref:Two-component system LytT family response regulator n=1 Tax=Granulicella aggregans TaxID=474949 RepID=A0A7W7Z9U3_9BACT|nr:LytTR family DNA-binding domain-containing protein [Granulicella aggregans]MBB5055421.1 two-component system LytT family response regulator [Granulicella aggregans]
MTALSRDGIRVLIVDDEAPARQRLSDLLTQDPEVSSVQEAGDGETAVRMILSERPDLVLLDVQMPELNGLEVIEAVGSEIMPFTVFVTAYDQHAMRAFEANALDYLLKPFSDERFETMLARAKRRTDDLHLLEFGQNVAQVLSSQAIETRHLDRLAIKTDGITKFVRLKDVDWIEAAGVYVTLHVSGKEMLYRASLADLEHRLDPIRFLRIHRSAIINIESIVQLEALSHGEFEVLLKDGSHPRVSRSYRSSMEKRLGQKL